MELQQKNLYHLKSIISHWKEDISDITIREEIETYLDEEEFYLDALKNKNQLYLGIDGKQYQRLLVEEELLLQSKKEIENKFSINLKPLPLPIIYSTLKRIELNTRKEIKALLSKIRRSNEKQVRNKGRKESLKQSYVLAHQLLHKDKEKEVYFISIDLEVWERNHDTILEIGYSIFNFKSQLFLSKHLIIKEHYGIRNQLPGYDNKEHFLFGKSQLMNLVDALKYFQNDINRFRKNLYLIGHDFNNDVKFLKKNGVSLEYSIFDTTDLYKHLNDQLNSVSLSNLLHYLNIDAFCFHNAGNDAHYTLRAFLALLKYNPAN